MLDSPPKNADNPVITAARIAIVNTNVSIQLVYDQRVAAAKKLCLMKKITYHKQLGDGSIDERVYKRARGETHKFLLSSNSSSDSEVSALETMLLIRLLIIHAEEIRVYVKI